MQEADVDVEVQEAVPEGTWARSVRSRWLPHAKIGGIALLDQGLFAGSNFILNVLLARWLEPAQYGAFALMYSFLLLLGVFHSAILTEPMTVFGAGKYRERFEKYLGILVSGHWMMTSVMAVVVSVFAFVCVFTAGREVVHALVGMALALPFIFLLWLLRRATYVISRPEWSAVGGVVYLSLVVMSLYGCSRINQLSASSALLIMGVSSAVVSAGLIGRLRTRWGSGVKDSICMNVLLDHWRYGRWSSASEALRASESAFFYWIIGSLVGLGAVAGVRAVGNIVAPIYQFFVAMGSILLPRAARRSSENGGGTQVMDAVRISVGLTVPALLYWGALIFAGSEIMRVLYGSKYDEYTALIPSIASVAVFSAVASGPNLGLRAVNRPDLLFCVSVFTVVLAVVLIWSFATHLGAYGAALGLSGSVFLGAALTWAFWLRLGSRAPRPL